jgi:hypothetical protein
MKKCTIAAIMLFLSPLFFKGTPVLAVQDPETRLEKFINHTASHKIYLHFNKSRYNAGDVMWFNTYLLNSVTHLPDTAQMNVYIDLISSDGVIMERRLLKASGGVAEGDISLPTTLPDGNYRIRAYTDLMRNFGEEYFFNRYFYISNSQYENIIPRSDIRTNRRFNRDLEQLAQEHSIAFFPEGGNMVDNVTNRVAFKAFDALGRGIEAEGTVIDANGNELVRFSTLHAGMGSFELQPESGSSYQALVSFNGGRALAFDLPRAVRGGLAMRVDRAGGNIIIRLETGLSPDDPTYVSEPFILAHTRGQVKYSGKLKLSAGGEGELKLPEEVFPPGITHLTVFAGRQPVAERLVFVKNHDDFVFSPRVFRMKHEGEDYIGIQMGIYDNEGNIREGNFSLSILQGNFPAPGSTVNMVSNILLTSDLGGVIEDPQEYLDPEKELVTELDHLMMTHGWRRFSWESVLGGDLPGMPHRQSSAISIRGRVTDPARDEPVNNFQVRMNVAGKGDSHSTRTDGRGYFEFDNLVYHDNFRIEVGSDRLAGNYPPKIELLRENIRGYDYTPNTNTREQQVTARGRDWRRVPEAGQSPYALAAERGPAPRQYGVPDQTIYIDRDRVTHRTVFDILVERAQGLQVQGNRLMFRGPTSINLSSEPMFMLNGVQTGRDVVLNMNPREIERIEIFRGTSASMFGVRGATGVIIAYQRAAGDPGFRDSREYLMTGYHSPREFYSDIVIPSARRESDEPAGRTIHWQPRFIPGGNEGTVFLPAAAASGKMMIVVEGVSHKGEVGTGIFTVELR